METRTFDLNKQRVKNGDHDGLSISSHLCLITTMCPQDPSFPSDLIEDQIIRFISFVLWRKLPRSSKSSTFQELDFRHRKFHTFSRTSNTTSSARRIFLYIIFVSDRCHQRPRTGKTLAYLKLLSLLK